MFAEPVAARARPAIIGCVDGEQSHLADVPAADAVPSIATAARQIRIAGKSSSFAPRIG